MTTLTANDCLYKSLSQPTYVIEETLLRHNLSLIRRVATAADVEIILAFKAFALWKTFPIFREYISATTASSLAEATMAVEKFGTPAHTYSPAYIDGDIEQIAKLSSHLTFNSLSQYECYAAKAKKANPQVSLGIRINPEYSEISTMLYNPCAKGSRFGIIHDQMPASLPSDIEGFHCHCHCESSADEFIRTLKHIEERFGEWMDKLKWINFGGGHLMTRADYDTSLLIETLRDFRHRHPNLHIILEPGSAFAWHTGPLVSQVVDIVENHGIKTAILNVSFTCHMPDCLEMPYYPEVRGARHIEECEEPNLSHVYRLGGNSCLSGDYMAAWQFSEDLAIGSTVIFEDMIHYTTVKTTMFNGIQHPAIAILHTDGQLEYLRRYTVRDYIDRMD